MTAESTAFADHESTVLGNRLAQMAADHPGESGFQIIRYGRPAFTARLVLTELAERTLDVQYYIWEMDPTGRILGERLYRAAERGVRIRLLLDDINLGSRDRQLVALSAHPNVDIRIFNPFKRRKLKGLDFLLDMDRVNHRMHNKLMVMDNAVAIVGGRNIGDHYFEVHTKTNFRDLDVAAVGPVVRDISAVFDRFWNGDWSVPVVDVAGRSPATGEMEAAIAAIRERMAADDYPYPLDMEIADLKARLDEVFANLVWAPGKIVWDDPSAIREYTGTGRMNEALHARLEHLESELFIESAYFVVRDRALAAVKRLHDQGVRIRILTNSLAANDVLAAHAGYSKHRKALLENGAELYELRPDPGPVEKKLLAGESKAALHTKALVFDRKDVFIGSFNLDPRSAAINTEAGLYVQSPALAAQVIEYMDAGIDAENAYRVLLDDNGDLRWIIEIGEHRLDYDRDPRSAWWQRLLAWLIRLLPIEHQL